MRDQYVAELPQAELDEDMLAAMRLKVGTRLRIEHSVNNDYASPIAVARFAGGIGDINPTMDRSGVWQPVSLRRAGGPSVLCHWLFLRHPVWLAGTRILSFCVSADLRSARVLGRHRCRCLRV